MIDDSVKDSSAQLSQIPVNLRAMPLPPNEDVPNQQVSFCWHILTIYRITRFNRTMKVSNPKKKKTTVYLHHLQLIQCLTTFRWLAVKSSSDKGLDNPYQTTLKEIILKA